LLRGGSSRGDDARWGQRFAVAGGEILVACDESLRLLYHNACFARAIGGPRGSYLGLDLGGFFPEAHRSLLLKGFRDLAKGPSSSLEFEAALLTRSEPVTVSGHAAIGIESGQRQVLLTMRARGAAEVAETASRADEGVPAGAGAAAGKTDVADPVAGLPAAIFRTDRTLSIEHASGDLWSSFQIDPSSLVGGSLVDPGCHLVPQFLHEVDYCDTMAGITLQSDLSWRGKDFVLTVEPFVNEDMKVVGALGILRTAKRIDASKGSEHLSYPRPEDYTQAIKLPRAVKLGVPVKAGVLPPTVSCDTKPKPAASTEPLRVAKLSPSVAPATAAAKDLAAHSPGPSTEESRGGGTEAGREIAELRSRIRPRSLTFEDFREALEAEPVGDRGEGTATKTREVSLPS